MEYWANAGQINPATARARFRESLEVLLKAWTQDGPVRHDGEFFNYRFLNPWPRPYQKPHPKLFVVGSGSMETVELALDFGLGYSIVFVPIPLQLKAFETMRELAAERGRTVATDDLIVVALVHVADSDEEAMAELRPHVETFFSWSHRVPPKYLLPPGYVSPQEFRRRVADTALANSPDASLGADARDPAHRVRHPGHGRRDARRLGPRRRLQPDEPDLRGRRHARMEGGQEHDALRRGGHAARPGAPRVWLQIGNRSLARRGVVPGRMTDNTSVIRSFYAALEGGDLPGALGLMTADVAWTDMDGFPYGGTYRGPDAVRDGILVRIGTDWDGFSMAVDEVLDAGDTVVGVGTYSGRARRPASR